MPNPSLMGNHQQGLADELSRSRYLFTCSAGDLARTIASYDPARLRPYLRGNQRASRSPRSARHAGSAARHVAHPRLVYR